MGLLETRIGIFPGGGTQRLPRIIGEAKALEMILRGLTVTGPRATKSGLCMRSLMTRTRAPWRSGPNYRAEALFGTVRSRNACASLMSKPKINTASTSLVTSRAIGGRRCGCASCCDPR
ncbi:enoyl-CoA hydratase-related protein [Bradyrhizobium sp. 2S1]|uniref:Enoyl-CoA hydratase n=1 Tax=Bradyrhizobium septentrionale TaxID=1404411 RepID=A0A973ZY55_9BRAD